MWLLIIQQAAHITDHPEEIGYLGALAWGGYYLVRHFFGKRKYEKKLRVLESKMESDGDSSMSGTKNPGRTTVDLLDVMYSDIKGIKETLTRHEGEIGKLKGKTGVN